jgi:hypothetical protein
MPKRRKKRKPPPTPHMFKVGDRIRARHGVMDTEYPDMPLGGWAGTITEIGRHGMYTVRWSRETLAAIHPVYQKRCERDGMMLEEYWLGDDDLEADLGGPLSIEQPGEITPRPLSPKNQDDRVRIVFGLTSDDLLPRPDKDSLETYYDYLGERLSFPFEARYCEEDNPFILSPAHYVQAVALGKEPHNLDEDDGIFCEAQTAEGEDILPLANLELRRSDRNRQLVDDYAAWFLGELTYEDDVCCDENQEDFYDGDESDEDDDVTCIVEKVTWRGVALSLAEFATFATCYCAVVGSAFAAMPRTLWGACIGASVCGIFVAIAQAAYARRETPWIMPRCGAYIAGFVGLTVGAVQGAFFGIAAATVVGPLVGGVLGAYSRQFIDEKKWVTLHLFPGRVLRGAACGVAAQAFCFDSTKATDGLRYGTLWGLAVGLAFCLVALPFALLAIMNSKEETHV